MIPQVTAENYHILATKTESPVTEEMKNRILMALPLIKELLDEQINLSFRMDRLKKYLFYNKNNGVSLNENFVFDPKVGERIVSNVVVRLLHSVLGLSSETGEIMEALVGHVFDGLTLDKINIKEEFGDVSWYTGIGCDAVDTTLLQVLTTNIEKLEVRYPEKFTTYHAENRDLESERKVLEHSENYNIEVFDDNDNADAKEN